MNGITIHIGDVSIIFNVVVRIITACIFLLFIIPLQFKESQVKNGLKKLRYELLITGVIIFLVNSVGLIIIVFRFFGVNIQLLADIVTYFNTLGFLTIAIIKYNIYHMQYTDGNKKLHERFGRMENAQNKRDLTKARKRVQ